MLYWPLHILSALYFRSKLASVLLLLFNPTFLLVYHAKKLTVSFLRILEFFDLRLVNRNLRVEFPLPLLDELDIRLLGRKRRPVPYKVVAVGHDTFEHLPEVVVAHHRLLDLEYYRLLALHAKLNYYFR